MERTFAWGNGQRRLSKDYEKDTLQSEAMIHIPAIAAISGRSRLNQTASQGGFQSLSSLCTTWAHRASAMDVGGQLGRVKFYSRFAFSRQPTDYPEKEHQNLSAALKGKDCRFLWGRFINSSTTLSYTGDTKALNLFLEGLSKCPGFTLSVRFDSDAAVWSGGGDWLLIHRTFPRSDYSSDNFEVGGFETGGKPHAECHCRE